MLQTRAMTRDDARHRVIEATRARACDAAAAAAAVAAARARGGRRGEDEREVGFGMTSTRVTHARVKDARDDAGDGVLCRVIEATRTCRAAAAAPPPPRHVMTVETRRHL